MMKKTLFTTVLAMLPFIASADIVEFDGIYYDVSDSAYTATIVSPPTDNPTGAPVVYAGDIFIPASIIYASPVSIDTVAYTVVAVGDSAFTDCSGLISIVLPETVTHLGQHAFSGCSSMSSITMQGVERIDEGAFSNCTSLYEMNFAEMAPNLKIIGDLAFSNCVGLTSLTLNEGLEYIGNRAFKGCQPFVFNITIPSTVTTILYGPFYCPASITVASGNTVYDSRDNCNAIIETATNKLLVASSLTTVIPSTVTSIGYCAFCDMETLESIDIPSSVTSIEGYAFAGTGLLVLDVPENVETIDVSAFQGCSNLTTVSLPSTLTFLGGSAFGGCVSLQSVTCNATTVPRTSLGAFSESNISNATLIVPSAALSSYQATEPWNQFSTVEATFDPNNPNEPDQPQTNVLADMENVGTQEYEINMPIEHGDAPATIDISMEPTEILIFTRSITSALGISDINEAKLYAQSSDGIVTDTLTAANGFWFDASDYVCQASDANRGMSINFYPDSLKFELTQQPNVYTDGESHTYSLYFIANNKYEQVDFRVNFSESEYTVTFIADSTELKSETLKYGSTVEAPAVSEKTGYTFAGWEPAFEATVTGDATYTALFTINNYKVTFVANGVEFSADSMAYGTAITAPEVPEIYGYTFTGWVPEVNATVPDGDVTYEAVYTPNTHTISFNTDDGATLRTDTIKYGQELTAPDAPAKTGYTFTGWEPAVPDTLLIDSDMVYTAHYSINSYRVTFLGEDGSTISSETMPYGTAITPPSASEHAGYTFTGWSPAVAETVPDSSVTYTAQYKVNKYLMTFTVDGTIFQQDSLEYGSAMVVPDSIPVKEGYTFNSWGGGLLPSTVPSHDETYPAYFNINHYNWIFMVDDSVVNSGLVPYGSPLLDPGVGQFTVKEGYTFSGWTPSPWPTQMPAEDLIIRGYFTINKYLVSFTIDGDTVKADSLDYGTAITAYTDTEKTGYTFSGWTPAVDATVPAHDVTYDGAFVPNSYLVKFVADSVEVRADSMTYGTAITAPEAPAKEGYTFTGWSPEVESTVPANDVTYTAQYVINSYLVKFIADSVEVRTDSMNYGTAITAPEAPAKEGYTFTGWSPEVAATVPANDVTYTAQYAINSYLVRFVSDTDSVIKSETLDFGTAITKPTDPKKTGYTFTGWTPEVDATVPAHDVTYKATFSINSYLVKFVIDGITVKSDSLTYGTAITAYTDTEKTGYTFSGWTPAVDTTVPANDVTYSGSFIINSYLVKFIADSVEVRTDSMNYGTAITAPEAPVKEGYTFTGWLPEVAATVPANDVTYTAQYAINSYLVTFKLDNDSIIEAKTQNYGTAITKPEDPKKEGYTFTGWSPEVAATVPANDVTYTATFTINSYKLVYQVDGETVDSTLVEYGSTIAPLENPTREGANFSGWIGLPEGNVMPAHDVIVTGTFSTNAYKVTFIANGSTYSETVVEYGAAIPLPTAEPAQEGYTFTGWGTVPETMPAENITLTAEFSINSYLVTFIADSVEVRADSVAYGTAITVPEAPAKEGYTFTGWSPEVDATVPAHDVTYTAQYSINKYLITFTEGGVVIKSDSLEYGTAVVAPEIRDKEAYVGWIDMPETMPAHDVDVQARPNTNLYLIAFIADSKTVLADSVAYGTAITAPEAPAKEGYTFTGWSPEVDATVPAHDVTYTAQYSINKYLLTFILEDEVLQSDSVEYGATIDVPEIPQREGYGEIYWMDVPETMPAHDMTIMAYVPPVNGYNIAFVVDSIVIYKETLSYGSAIIAPEAPAKEGYTFTGWSPELDATVPAHDVTYTAQFRINSYLVTFQTPDQIISADSLQYGTAITAPEAPAIEGYTFTGWTPTLDATVPGKDVTYTAIYVINSHEITFLVDGDIYSTTTLQYGSGIETPEDPKKEGYTFKGWTPEVAATVPDSSVTYTAQFDVNYYRVTFADEDGTTYQSESLAYGSAITAPANPTKEGHTFVGWSPRVDATVPDYDVTYVAQWDVDPALIAVHEELIAEQTALEQKKDSIDANYNASVAKYNELLSQYETIVESAAPFANKFAAETAAIGQQLAALQTPIDSYSQFQTEDFTAEIEELYNERTLLSQQTRIEAEIKNASAKLDVLSDSVDAVVAAINQIAADMEALQTAIANATVTPRNGIAVVADPMGGLDAILQNKEAVTKLTITGQMEGNDFAALQKVENVEELTLPAVNSKTDSIRLGSLSSLLVVNLEDANTVLGDEVFTGCNPNLMVYAVKGAEIGVLNCNVILSGEAEEVVLTDGYPVRIPDSFSAQRISYTRSFSKKTYIGQSAGWETLALPFTVDNITAQDGRSLVPFGQKADANFWLATIGETGFNAVDAIEANKPYLVAMPNNSAYTDGNITGNVTFSATDAVVSPTIVAEPVNAYYTFTAVYEGEPDYENIYIINDNDYQSYYPGSVFVRGLRAVRPFEAFITTNATENVEESGAKQRNLIPIGINSATSLMQIAADGIDGQPAGVFSLDGRKVADTTDNLPAGIYIVGGKKYIVR